MYKTATECLNILKYEIESSIDKFVALKKQGKQFRKKHLLKEAITKIAYKQTMWKLSQWLPCPLAIWAFTLDGNLDKSC